MDFRGCASLINLETNKTGAVQQHQILLISLNGRSSFSACRVIHSFLRRGGWGGYGRKMNSFV